MRRRVVRSVWSCQKYVVYRKDLDTGYQPVRPQGVRFRLASMEDLSWMCDQMDHLGDHAEPILLQQLQETDMTVVGLTEEGPPELVFSLWLSHGDFGLRLLNKHTGAADVSIRRVWVPPARRQMGIATQGFLFAQHVAKEAGICRFWSFVDEDNIASRRLHQKRGYQDFGRIRFVKRFRKRYAKSRLVGQHGWSVCVLPDGIVKL